jgi:CPA2 family monovalent cation:H+ antiporter-2
MHDLPVLTTIASALTAAWILGLFTQWLRLSPIVGYILAGIAIGPYTPGYIGDVNIAQQLSEIGIILIMFGVGLHFHLDDLLAVRNIAIPGAYGQSVVATALGVAVALAFGWSFKSGMVLGMAMAVASTVVLIRVLTDNRLLDTTHGHVAVGWLIVEDIFTVVILVIIPVMGKDPAAFAGKLAGNNFWAALGIAMVKLAALVALLLWGGARVIPWVMVRVARLRSRELFTLTVLVVALAVATGSYFVFGASMALGAFLAGMVVGQSAVSSQAAADALPLRDAFAVLFFTSVGMLFEPRFVIDYPGLLAAGLAIVMIGKPLAALLIVAIIGYPARTALVVALGLAQIGEFSFIISELARNEKIGLLDKDAHNLLVATAIISITLNPILFKLLPRFEALLQRWPALWRFLNRRAGEREYKMNEAAGKALEQGTAPVAVILGYGPVGRSVDALLRDRGVETVVVDLNMDTIQALTREGRPAMYGDAYNIEVMHKAMARATHMVITLPHAANRNPLIAAAKLINPEIKIFVRAHYIAEREDLAQVGADAACYEEVEVAVALAKQVLADRGADEETIRKETIKIRQALQAASPTL